MTEGPAGCRGTMSLYCRARVSVALLKNEGKYAQPCVMTISGSPRHAGAILSAVKRVKPGLPSHALTLFPSILNTATNNTPLLLRVVISTLSSSRRRRFPTILSSGTDTRGITGPKRRRARRRRLHGSPRSGRRRRPEALQLVRRKEAPELRRHGPLLRSTRRHGR